MLNKGTVSNLISATLLVVGLILGFADVEGTVPTLLLSVGMFAFSGGITNSIAVKMLFDKVPGLYGSGVIQARFTEIRREIKKLILEQFFTEAHLRDFLQSRTKDLNLLEFIRSKNGSGNPVEQFVDKQWKKLTNEDVIKPMLAEQVDKILSSPMGGMLSLIGRDTIDGLVSKFVLSFIESMESKVKEEARKVSLDSDSLGFELDEDQIIKKLRTEVSSLLERRLEQLTPKQVKQIMEDVIRNHLGWLVVWGNVVGGLIGFIAPFVNGSI